MSSGYEKLGIEIDFKFAEGLQEVITKIEAAFKKIKIGNELTGGLAFTKKQLDGIALAVGKSAEEVSKGLSSVANNKKIQDGVSSFRKYELAINEVTSATRKLEQEQGQQLLSAINNTKKATTAQQQFNKVLTEAHNINKQSDWNKQAGTIGQNYASFGNGFVRSSALTFDPNNAVEMNKAHAAAAKLNGQFQTGTKTINAFTASFGRMTTRLAEFYSIRTVMFAVTGQVREAIAATLDFNQALHDTAAIAGSSVNEMKQFEKLAVSIATSSRFSLAQTTEIMKTLAQAGIKANDMPDMTKATALFATGAGATPAQAVDLMTTSLNAYELKAQDGMRVSNALTAALNASKLEAGGLSTAFNYLANQSEMMGFELEETLGIIAAFSNRGVKSSTIGTGVSSLMVDLAAPKPRFAKLMKEYKVGLEEINPMTHSFAEVIARLEKAAIPVDRILASMDKRIGKALVTALNIGADGFELMTRAITGTDSALIANEKAMQGARAQLNVLKSEFTVAVKEIGDSLSGPISAGFSIVRAAVSGLGTEAGRATLAVAGLSTAALIAGTVFMNFKKAIEGTTIAAALFTKLNPWILAFTAVVGGSLALLTAFGAKKQKLKEQDEAYIKTLTKQAGVLQQAEMSLIDFLGKIDKKTQIVKEGKDEYVKFTDEQRASLNKLVTQYPDYLGKLDLEKTKLEELKVAIDNVHEARIQGSYGAVEQYNLLAMRNEANIGKLKESPGFDKVQELMGKQGVKTNYLPEALDDLENKLSGKDPFFNKYSGVEKELEILKKFRKENKSVLEDIKKTAATKETLMPAVSGIANMDLHASGEFWAKVPPKAVAKTKTGDDDSTVTSSTTKEQKDTLDEAMKYITEYRTKLQISSNKDIEAVLVKSFNDEGLSIEKKTENMYKAWEKIEENSAIELMDEKQKLLDKLFGYDSEKIRKDPKLLEQYKIAFEELDKGAVNDLDKSLQALTDKFESGTKLKIPTLSADIVDKQQDRRIRNAQQSNAIAKDMAKTAEQVHALELDQLRLEIDANTTKKQSFQLAIGTLQKTIDATAESDRHGDNWDKLVSLQDSYNDRLDETVRLTNELSIKLSDSGNTSFWYNFEKGVTTAVKSLGTFKTQTQSLGGEITNTLADGLTGTIDNMITSLAEGENAWKSFRDGVGNVLGDIAKELQKHVAELIAVWAVQQLVGIATSAGSSGNIGAGGGWGNGGNVNFGPGMASGGLVTGGVKGRDSVPAILMPEEYVVRTEAVRKYGVDFMKDLNEGKVKKFAEGGSAGGFSAGSKESSGKGQEVGLTIINVADPNSVPSKTNSAEIMNVVSFAIDRRDPVIKKLKAFIKEA